MRTAMFIGTNPIILPDGAAGHITGFEALATVFVTFTVMGVLLGGTSLWFWWRGT